MSEQPSAATLVAGATNVAANQLWGDEVALWGSKRTAGEREALLHAEEQYPMGHVMPATPACQSLLMRLISAAWPMGSARGGGSRGGEPGEWLAPAKTFIQRLA